MTGPADVPVSGQRKGIIAGVLAGLSALSVALLDERLTMGEGVAVAIAAIAAYAAVFGVKNTPS